MKPALIALALMLAGCCEEKEVDAFGRCERNGFKIGTREFDACKIAVDLYEFDKRHSR